MLVSRGYIVNTNPLQGSIAVAGRIGDLIKASYVVLYLLDNSIN